MGFGQITYNSMVDSLTQSQISRINSHNPNWVV